MARSNRDGDGIGSRRLCYHARIAAPRTTTIVLVTAASAILLRTLVYLLYEQINFDSDQAIVGLMAKHLVEARAFPLFFYGQTYMLGVESWVAAPFFLVAGPTVTALRVSLLAWNIAFAVLAIVALKRDNSLHPWLGFVAASIFLLAPPSIAAQLMNAQGGIVEPFVYVAALWLLRRRPLWFGAVLAIGFRNREFVAYAVPAMLAVEWLSGEIDSGRVRDWLAASVVFAVLWQVVEALKPFADLKGPGTRGSLLGGFSGSQIGNLVDRFDFGFAVLPGRAARLLPEISGWFSGAVQVDSGLPIPNRPWIAVASVAFLAAVVIRLIALLAWPPAEPPGSWAARAAGQVRRANFALYLAAVGAIAITAFVAGKPVLPGYSRYALLGLALPIGLIGAFLALEPHPGARGTAVAIVILWSLIAARDHAAIVFANVRQPAPNPLRIVADRLTEEGVSAATAFYWRAYVITFLSRERLRVASRDFVRIEEYQDLFDERQREAVVISDEPCPGGRRLATLYVCKP
jgi:hypothetical protein